MEKKKCQECGLASCALLCPLRTPPASVAELRAMRAELWAVDARLQAYHDGCTEMGEQWSVQQLALHNSVRQANKRTLAILDDVLRVRGLFEPSSSQGAT